MSLTIQEEQIKDLFKQALLELITEERDLFSELFSEAVEEIALMRAIQEGEESEVVSKDEVLNLLNTPV